MNRWAPFSDEELATLLDEILWDDGIKYEPDADDLPIHALVQEIRAELDRRERRHA